MFIYQKKEWPNFKWNSKKLNLKIGEVRNLQGRLVGKMENIGFDLRNEANLTTLTTEIVKSNEIEGEILNSNEVRSSIARRLGIEIAGLVESSRNVDGVVDMMLDATQNYVEVISKDRLFSWHNSLFPTGRSGMLKILVAEWRDDSTGPMQVVSGAMGKEKIHFQAPPAEIVEDEMEQYLTWLNSDIEIDSVLKAGIAHFWFITIHPFEDGNGRIARAITELMLSRSDQLSQRFYSMSAQITQDRKSYYEILEKSQKGKIDITNWLDWFLDTLLNSLKLSDEILSKVMEKYHFWLHHNEVEFNERQKKILTRLFDGFKGKLTSSKWAKMNKCSRDTALRDIQDLQAKGILRKTNEGGRSTNYELIPLKD